MDTLTTEDELNIELEKITSLKKLAGDVKSVHDNIEKAGADAQKELGSKDNESIDEQLNELRKKLPDTDPIVIPQIMTQVNDAIDQAQTAEDTAKADVTAAQQALEEAKARQNAADSKLREVQANFSKLPADIKTAQERVTKVRTLATKTFTTATTPPLDQNQLRIAFYLLTDLRAALETLETLSSLAEEVRRRGKVTELWETLSTAKAAVAKAQAALAAAQKDLADATKALKDLRDKREAEIQKRLAEPPDKP